MGISIITFADLGKKTNLKTIGIMPVIETFVAKGQLDSIACRTNTGFSFAKTYTVLPLFVRAFLKLLQYITVGLVSSRALEERLFDFFSYRYINSSSIVLFHPEYFFQKSLRKIKLRGAITVGLATMAHLETNAKLEEEEQKLLGIKNPYYLYQRLLKNNHYLNDFYYLIASSDFIKSSYIAAGFSADRIFVAGTDIDTKSFTSSAKKDDVFRVVYVAHTGVLKGLHYLFDAWREAKLVNAELVIIGDFDRMAHELSRRYISVINNDSSIKFLGNLSRTETIQQYYNANVSVLPSLTEGNPRVVLEAMTAGLPIITTEHAIGMVQDTISGFIVPIRDSSAICAKLQYLQAHPDIATTMGQAGRRAIEEKKPFGEAVFEIYETIKHAENI